MKGGNDCQEGIKKEVPGEQKWTEVHCIEMHSVRIRDQGIRACYVTAVRVGGTFWGLSLFHPPFSFKIPGRTVLFTSILPIPVARPLRRHGLSTASYLGRGQISERQLFQGSLRLLTLQECRATVWLKYLFCV